MQYTFTYIDEQDKCYGLCGMALALYAGDSADMLKEVSLDSDDAQISFTPDFFFCSNPRYSAKLAWGEMLKQYRTLTHLVAANVLSRHILLHRRAVTATLLAEMLSFVEEEGHVHCQLEADEIEHLFNASCSEMRRLFSSPQAASATERLASALSERRALSGSDIADIIER